MKVSREQVAENRRKILGAAGRLFREKGFEAVTVAEVMRAAGLTHGGFYGYFKSKEELIAETLAQVFAPAKASEGDLARFVAAYLAPRHRDDLASGCPTAALAGESLRQSPAVRAAMTAGLKGQLERLGARAPGASAAERRRSALGSWAALVGAVILARMSDDAELSDEILAETRAWLAGKGAARPRKARAD